MNISKYTSAQIYPVVPNWKWLSCNKLYLVSSPLTVIHGQGECRIDAPRGLHFVLPFSCESRISHIISIKYWIQPTVRKTVSFKWCALQRPSDTTHSASVTGQKTHHHVGHVRRSDPGGVFLSSHQHPYSLLWYLASWKQDLHRKHLAFGWKSYFVPTGPVKC